MLHADTTRWSQLADKYRVREYVEQCGLGWMLNELYGVWESAEEIDFSGRGNLPDTFVLKTNNGYGQVIIVNDRQKADIRSIRRTLNHTLRKKFGRMTAEHHYLVLNPALSPNASFPQNQHSAIRSSTINSTVSMATPIVAWSATTVNRHPTSKQDCTMPGHGKHRSLRHRKILRPTSV